VQYCEVQGRVTCSTVKCKGECIARESDVQYSEVHQELIT
jgi:hypothetical protein